MNALFSIALSRLDGLVSTRDRALHVFGRLRCCFRTGVALLAAARRPGPVKCAMFSVVLRSGVLLPVLLVARHDVRKVSICVLRSFTATR